jgi:hypothetical protein
MRCHSVILEWGSRCTQVLDVENSVAKYQITAVIEPKV